MLVESSCNTAGAEAYRVRHVVCDNVRASCRVLKWREPARRGADGDLMPIARRSAE
jgi:hypothetical protein